MFCSEGLCRCGCGCEGFGERDEGGREGSMG